MARKNPHLTAARTAYATYRNPWHKPNKPECGPAMYEAQSDAELYRGYSIYVRGAVWDVVRDGACITQMAGPNGARSAVDQLIAGTFPY